MYTASEIKSLDRIFRHDIRGKKRGECNTSGVHLLQIFVVLIRQRRCRLETILRLLSGVVSFLDDHMIYNMLLDSLGCCRFHPILQLLLYCRSELCLDVRGLKPGMSVTTQPALLHCKPGKSYCSCSPAESVQA